jgi:hypothetical protein
MNQSASELIKTEAGVRCFCQDCELVTVCNHSYGKIHPISLYVYRYLQDIEAGFKIYPHGKSWEYEPEWFINLLNSAQNELHKAQADKAERDAKHGKH